MLFRSVEERIFDGKNGVPVFLPMTVAPINSKNILIEGISIKDPIFWNLVPQYCDNIIIRGVKVESTLGRTDGIDIESSTNALIEYTTIECGDDCFTIKIRTCGRRYKSEPSVREHRDPPLPCS